MVYIYTCIILICFFTLSCAFYRYAKKLFRIAPVKTDGGRFAKNSPVKKGFNNGALISFAVVSDVHVSGDILELATHSSSKYAKALRLMNEMQGNAFLVAGDLVQSGKAKQYLTAKKIAEKNLPPHCKLILIPGNHEYYAEKEFPKNDNGRGVMNRFFEYTGMENKSEPFNNDFGGVFFDVWVNNFHFISFCNNRNSFSQKRLAWLSKKITEPVSHEKELDPTRPVFIFFHEPFADTTYGSDSNFGGCNKNEVDHNKLKEVLKDFQNVIVFTGHSHYCLEHPFNIANFMGYIAVNDSSLSIPDFACEKRAGLKKSQGLFVCVYSDKTVIHKIGFHNKSFIGNPYIIYRDNPFSSPVFDKLDPPVCNNIIRVKPGKRHSTVRLAKASCDSRTRIEAYEIFLNGEPQKQDNSRRTNKLYLSLFEPEKDYVDIKINPGSGKLKVVVYDSHRNFTEKEFDV